MNNILMLITFYTHEKSSMNDSIHVDRPRNLYIKKQNKTKNQNPKVHYFIAPAEHSRNSLRDETFCFLIILY
jgi:hypothetical protein